MGKKLYHPPETYVKKTILEPQDIQIMVPYAITINFDPKVTSHTPDFWKTLYTETEIINTLYCNYELYPELSRAGKLHWHGIITFNNDIEIAHFYATVIPKLLHNSRAIEVDTIDDLKYWKEYYCKKCKHIMKPYLLRFKRDYKLSRSFSMKQKYIYSRAIKPTPSEAKKE